MIMKKIFAITAACFVLNAAFAWSAFADKPVAKGQLPQRVHTFLTTNYPKTKIAYATVDNDLFDTTYDVALEDGTRLEFAKNGEWLEMKSPRGGSIPLSAVPSKIAAYIKLNYPGAGVRQIEIDGRDCEVELTNGVEITFNRRHEMVRSTDYNKHRPDHRFTLRE